MPKKKSESEQKLNLVDLKAALDNAEKQIRLAKKLLFGDLYREKAAKLSNSKNIVEGVFDGMDMIGADGKKYPVPSNYASKSKLVAGDIMKLSISDDGIYTYKQIGPVERSRIRGVLCETDEGYHVEVKDKVYNILAASVTYFRAKDGDKVALLVSRDQESDWAAVDNILSD